MISNRLLVVALGLLSGFGACYGAAMEQVGPASVQGHPTVAQPDWPAGIVELVQHKSRVYSIWVNGNENFYFNASPDEINALIRLFSQTRMRDHEIWLKAGNKQVKSFKKDKIDYNVNLHLLGGIALHRSRRTASPDTNEPALTVYVDPNTVQDLLKQILLPANIILNNEIANCSLEGKAIKPKRKVWHTKVQFEDATPAADFEHGLSTKVTLWEKDDETGINLGKINHKGDFFAVLSDDEIADLKLGESWLTLTVGNGLTETRRNHPKLPLDKLATDKQLVQPVKISKPKFYHGRILFEDGSPAILDPAPWPGAEIHVTLSYTGPATLDSDGYFKIYLSREQFEKAKSDKVRKNIFLPNYEVKGSSTARFAYPVSKLSQDKKAAGIVTIPKPQ